MLYIYVSFRIRDSTSGDRHRILISSVKSWSFVVKLQQLGATRSFCVFFPSEFRKHRDFFKDVSAGPPPPPASVSAAAPPAVRHERHTSQASPHIPHMADVACGPDEPYKEPRLNLRSEQKAEDVVDVMNCNNKECMKMQSDDEVLKQVKCWTKYKKVSNLIWLSFEFSLRAAACEDVWRMPAMLDVACQTKESFFDRSVRSLSETRGSPKPCYTKSHKANKQN